MPTTVSQPVTGDAAVPGSSSAIVCVLVPQDAAFDSRIYVGSGRQIGRRVAHYVEKAGRTPREIPWSEDRTAATCHAVGGEQVLTTDILYYEDRVSGWSGKPDHINLRLNLIDMAGTAKRSVLYSARTNMIATSFLEWGNANPTALLGSDFGEDVKRLVGKP